ncbi:MAG: hypothetical protein CL610_19550 [Anaerolineaceae bacterium]|nr:hypothetical protein [Anaerolineaceae bacterium]
MRLVYIALGLVAGVVLAANNASGSPVIAAIWLILISLSIAAAWLSWPDQRLRWSMIALVAFALGGWRMSAVPTTSEVARFNNTGGLTIEGIVAAEPERQDTQTLVRINAETLTRTGQTFQTSGLVLARVTDPTPVHYGDRVAITGRLITPAEFDTFSYADYLARTGIFSIMQQTALEVLEPAAPDLLLNFKAQAAQHIANHLPEPQASLLTGVLLGDENGIAPQVADAFSRVGAAHVIAISGFNMVILSGAIMGTLKRVRLTGVPAAVIGILAIGVYTLFVGAGAAVVRAALMSSLLIIGTAIRRKAYVPASLAFVAILLALINPAVLWDVSFQLSFFATLGLALFADPLTRSFDRTLNWLLPVSLARSLSKFLAEPVIVTLAVQITTLPLIVLYFNRLSLVVILTNLLIVPVQAAILFLGISATLVAFVLPALGQILYWYNLILLSWTTGVVRWLARLPFADVEFYVDPHLITLFFFLLIGAALMQATQPAWALRLSRILRQRAIASAAVFGGFATAVLIGAVFLSRPDANLHVWLLDVGHSNAILVQTPGGAHMLVDGGRFPSRLLTALGDRLPFNDREIEVLVLTQPDENEYAALPAVLNRYDVGVVLTNGQPNLGPAYTALQEQLAAHTVVNVTAGYRLELDDGVVLEVLHPASPPTLDNSLDEVSLVLRLSYGDVSILLTGDLSPAGQQTLLNAGHWPAATVLQLPRHGGIRSLDMAFLEAVQPQVALVQADRANRQGDPDPDTLALLGDIPLFRTDEAGTIHLWTDGDQLWAISETASTQ